MIVITVIFMLCCFIPRVLKLACMSGVVEMGLGNCEGVDKTHCIEMLNCHGYTMVQKAV